MRHWVLPAILSCALASAADAAPEPCTASIDGKILDLSYDLDSDPWVAEHDSFRAIFASLFSDTSCPAYTTLRHVTPDLNDTERGPFCLTYDADRKTYLGAAAGDRDAYGVCKVQTKTICQRVNGVKDTVLTAAGITTGASLGASAAAQAAGVTAVTHSSGAYILTGSAGYIAGTLGTAATTALGLLTAPATLIGGTITLVGVGGAVYLCKE